MKSSEIDHFSQELRKIREWTIKAEEDCKNIAKYNLPIVSPMRDLALPIPYVMNDPLFNFMGGLDNQVMHPEGGCNTKDVVVLKKSDSVADSAQHPLNVEENNHQMYEDALNKI